MQGVGAAADRRPPGVRPAIAANLAAVIASPIAATCPIAGAPRTIISRMAKATSPADRHVVLDERVGEVALVDEVQDAVVLAERRAEAGRGGAAGAPCAPAVRRRGERAAERPPGSRMAPAASAEARCRAWAAPATVAARLDDLAGELAEEPAPAKVDRVGPAAPCGAPGRHGVRRPPRGARPVRARGDRLRASGGWLVAWGRRWGRSIAGPRCGSAVSTG